MLLALLGLTALALGATQGWREITQATINGIVAGNYYALGAVGLTLIFGVLRLVNFAHGEFLTLGAYLCSSSPRSTFRSLALRRLRRHRDRGLQRRARGRRLAARPTPRGRRAAAAPVRARARVLHAQRDRLRRRLGGPADRRATSPTSVSLGELRIGRTELIVTLLGIATIVLVAVWRSGRPRSGKQARALADSIELAETTGIDTDRIVLVTWAVSGGLAGLAGIFYALPAGAVNPGIGFSLILSIFAAVVVGGIGNAYGALAGGLLIGLVQEWSTLVIEPSDEGRGRLRRC